MSFLNAQTQLKKIMKQLKNEFPFAASVALNDAAFAVREELGQVADNKSEGGATPFTKKDFLVKQKARKNTLEAVVGAKDRQGKYLSLLERSGLRRPGDYATSNRFVVLPGSAAKKNRFGNMSRGYLRRELRKPGTFQGDVTIRGVLQSGMFRRVGKGKGSKLLVLAIFKERSDYKKENYFGFRDAISPRFFRELSLSFSAAISDLSKFGKVRSSSARKKPLTFL